MAEVKNFGKFFGKKTISEVNVNNPRTEFLKKISPSLKDGAIVTVRGTKTNFFVKIFDGKTAGLEDYEIISKSTNLPNNEYLQSDGKTPVKGQIDEIVLKKKPSK